MTYPANSSENSKWISIWNNCLKEYKDENAVSSRRSRPTLVLSVIGDSDSFVPKPWPTNVFQTALIEAAKSGEETWILYRGQDEGVSKVVKEGYKNYEAMEYEINTKANTGPLRRIKLISTLEKKIEKSEECTSNPLLEFEKFVSEQKIFYFGTDVDYELSVPVAIIVCEGDIQTISHISNAVRKQLPVIIMKGSGKAADLVVDYLDNCAEHVIRKNSSLLFGIKFDEAKYKKIKEHLDLIEENRELVGIFDLDQDDPLTLSNLVGEGVVSCWSIGNIIQIDKETKKQGNTKADDVKNLTVYHNFSGNSIGGASLPNKSIQSAQFLRGLKSKTRPFVLNPKLSTSTSLPLYFFLGYQILQERKDLMADCGNVFLFEALKANRCDYVWVLLDQGVQIKKDNVDELFAQSHNVEQGNSPRSAKEKCRRKLRYKEFDDEDKSEDDTISDLLLWALLEKREDLAELFWLRGTDHLLSGLVCSAFLKELSKAASKKEDLLEANAWNKISICFEQRCIMMMDKMYEENQTQTIDILKNRASVWGISSSPLNFAYENLMYDVVAHACSRKYMKIVLDDDLATDKKCLSKCLSNSPVSPRKTYKIHFVIFFFVLVMYSAFVLRSIDTEYYIQGPARIFEYTVYIWGFGDLLEEILSLIGCLDSESRSHLDRCSRVCRYLTDFWNVVDMLSYILLLAALFLRHLYQDGTETHTYARNMFALSLLFLYLRFLGVFLIWKETGIPIIMIIKMLRDLLEYILIAVCVILGVGIYYHANLWPDHQTLFNGDLTRWRIWTIIFHPYWQLYGEVDLEILDGSNQDNCTNIRSIWEADPNTKRCPQEDWTVPVIAGLHMLFANLLLVNLVIAKFSNTFERVQADSEKWWYYHLYTVVTDYAHRIPSPINLILRPPMFILYLLKRFGFCNNKISDSTQNSTTADNIKAYQQGFQKIVALRNYKS